MRIDQLMLACISGSLRGHDLALSWWFAVANRSTQRGTRANVRRVDDVFEIESTGAAAALVAITHRRAERTDFEGIHFILGDEHPIAGTQLDTIKEDGSGDDHPNAVVIVGVLAYFSSRLG